VYTSYGEEGTKYEIYDSNGIFIQWGTIFPKPGALLKITE
jgi:hypothetical protein